MRPRERSDRCTAGPRRRGRDERRRSATCSANRAPTTTAGDLRWHWPGILDVRGRRLAGARRVGGTGWSVIDRCRADVAALVDRLDLRRAITRARHVTRIYGRRSSSPRAAGQRRRPPDLGNADPSRVDPHPTRRATRSAARPRCRLPGWSAASPASAERGRGDGTVLRADDRSRLQQLGVRRTHHCVIRRFGYVVLAGFTSLTVRHGADVERIRDIFDADRRAAACARSDEGRVAASRPLQGFGHSVYRTVDRASSCSRDVSAPQSTPNDR